MSKNSILAFLAANPPDDEGVATSLRELLEHVEYDPKRLEAYAIYCSGCSCEPYGMQASLFDWPASLLRAQ